MAQHKKRRASRRRSPWLIGGVVAVAAVAGGGVAIASVSRSSNSRTSSVPTTTVPSAAQLAQAAQAKAQLAAQLASSVAVTPAAGATGVAPDTPVTIRTSRGKLSGVELVTGAGALVPGVLGADSRSWSYSASLAPSTTYQLAGNVDGPDGLSVPFHSTFSTLTPAAEVTNTLYPLDGQTVGVGEPVIVKFNRSITTAAAQAAVLTHFSVTESAPVPGGWRWFSPRELHFRPQVYWPTGEQVAVSSDLGGWDAGGGMWGIGTVSVHFAVGDSHVATANLATHQMVVTNNGATIATYPISAGSTTYPTMNGTHIALDKESVVHMVSSTVGIPVNSAAGYDEMVYSDVHISDSGEYVHAAPWSVGAQGHVNVSHGCINLAPANAASFMSFSQVGDVIVVTGGPRPPVLGDHGVMDWSTDWSQFTAGTVTPATPPTPATTVAASPAARTAPSPGTLGAAAAAATTAPATSTTVVPPTATTKPGG